MKLQFNKVMIITMILLVIVFLIIMYKKKATQMPVLDPVQQNLATQVITLPDGHHILAAVDVPEDAHGWIGATLTDLTHTIRDNLHYAEQYGVYIQDTYVDSPAQVAGILPGDILIKINNTDAQDVLPAINLIAALHPGNAYPFTIYRQGKYLDYSVTVSRKENYL